MMLGLGDPGGLFQPKQFSDPLVLHPASAALNHLCWGHSLHCTSSAQFLLQSGSEAPGAGELLLSWRMLWALLQSSSGVSDCLNHILSIAQGSTREAFSSLWFPSCTARSSHEGSAVSASALCPSAAGGVCPAATGAVAGACPAARSKAAQNRPAAFTAVTLALPSQGWMSFQVPSNQPILWFYKGFLVLMLSLGGPLPHVRVFGVGWGLLV